MATKLKEIQLTSVDLVKAGANQEANICLYKSADQQEPPKAPETSTEREQNLFKRFLNWLNEDPAESHTEPQNSDTDVNLFNTYTDALAKSIQSIHDDASLNEEQKIEMIEKSVGQFNEAITWLNSVGDIPPEHEETVEKAESLTTDDDRFDCIEEVFP